MTIDYENTPLAELDRMAIEESRRRQAEESAKSKTFRQLRRAKGLVDEHTGERLPLLVVVRACIAYAVNSMHVGNMVESRTVRRVAGYARAIQERQQRRTLA